MRVPYTALLVLSLGCAASTCAAAPSISGVTNSASNVPPSLPNSGIAQGSIFAVYGSGLGPATLQEVQSYPLPSAQGLGGTTVQVTVGAVTETCIMFYTVATQVAAILPSATPIGNGTLTVFYLGQSGSIAITVVAANFGTYTLNEDGSGLAVVTDAFYNVITMINPANPGENLVLWGTGLGPVTGNETQPPVPVDLHSGIQVFVGNQAAAVLYGGRSGDAGLDQVNFTVPTGVTPGCKVSIAVLVNGIAGNVTALPVAPAGQSTCADSASGILTTANLQKAAKTGTLNAAVVGLARFGPEPDELSATFSSYPLATFLRSYGGSAAASIGSCLAYEFQGTSPVFSDPVQPPGLDAGPSLMITGPNGTKTAPATGSGMYSEMVGASGTYITPGAYTVSNGSGGANVAAFNWALTLPPPISFTNPPAVVNRAQGLTLTWSNSSSFAGVSINGVSGVPLTSGNIAYVEFFCTADASTGQFTIPSVILELLPPNGYAAVGVKGVTIQIAGAALKTYTVGGAPGVDAADLSVFTANGGTAAIQ
jgi:uncharacterized protein (TIGR03437 family)